MFSVGEIVQIFSPIASKKKFHVCVCCANEHGVERFLFINSGTGYDADVVVDENEIPCLPESPTGQSVISCSMIVQYSESQLKKFGAKKLGDMNIKLIKLTFEKLQVTKSLSKEERTPIVESLKSFLARSSNS